MEYASPMNAVEIILRKLQKENLNFLLNFYRHPRNRVCEEIGRHQ